MQYVKVDRDVCILYMQLDRTRLYDFIMEYFFIFVPAKVRRQPKAVKPKKMIKMEGKVIVQCACNSGTSAMVTKQGELYMFGKDTIHIDPVTGKYPPNPFNFNMMIIKLSIKIVLKFTIGTGLLLKVLRFFAEPSQLILVVNVIDVFFCRSSP